MKKNYLLYFVLGLLLLNVAVACGGENEPDPRRTTPTPLETQLTIAIGHMGRMMAIVLVHTRLWYIFSMLMK